LQALRNWLATNADGGLIDSSGCSGWLFRSVNHLFLWDSWQEVFMKPPNLYRVIRLAAINVFFLLAGYFVCLQAFIELTAKKIPPQWSSTLGELTLDQISRKIGPPREDASAKQFQNWIEYHWWGIKMLKVVSRDYRPTARPSQISYIVFLKGKYAPIYQQTVVLSAPPSL
jgi:hypothetical protein